MSLIEENIQKLMVMGFPDEEIIRKALNKADNDVNEAVTYLTDPNFGHDELLLNSNESIAPPLIGPLTREQLEQQQQQQIVRWKDEDFRSSFFFFSFFDSDFVLKSFNIEQHWWTRFQFFHHQRFSRFRNESLRRQLVNSL